MEALSDPSTTYTVFAPTNEAFEKFLRRIDVATVDDIDTDTLTKLLKYHVVPVAALSTDLTDGQVLETLDVPETLTVDLSDGVKLVGFGSNSTVIASDKLAGNSVVHVVDDILLPLFEDSVIGIALANDLSIFADLMTLVGFPSFAWLPSPYQNFTVLAPTNEAFAAAFTELGFDSLDDIPKSLNSLKQVERDIWSNRLRGSWSEDIPQALIYHLIDYEYKEGFTSDQLSDGQVFDTLVLSVDDWFISNRDSRKVTVDLKSEPGSIIFKGYGSDATVVTPDVVAGNIVVHVIDTVLLPFLPPEPTGCVTYLTWGIPKYDIDGRDKKNNYTNARKRIKIGENPQAPLGAIQPAVSADGAIARPGRNEPPQTIVGSACGRIRNAREIKGKYCLVNTTGCGYRRKFQNCKAAGAVGAIAISEDNTVTSFNVPGIDPDFPFVMVSKTQGDEFIRDIGAPDTSIGLGIGPVRRILTLGGNVSERYDCGYCPRWKLRMKLPWKLRIVRKGVETVEECRLI